MAHMLDYQRLFKTQVWRELLSVGGPWVYLAVGTEEELDLVVGTYRLEHASTAPGLRILRGARCSDKESFFDEIAAVLQFPYWFFYGWDALEECIQEILWLPTPPAYILFFTQVRKVLRQSEGDFRTLLGILERAARWWAAPIPPDNWRNEPPRPAVPFKIVFHAERRSESAAQKRLGAAGIDPVGLPLYEYRLPQHRS